MTSNVWPPPTPRHKKARDAVRARRPTWRLAVGWLVLGLAALGTLAHALQRILRRLPRRSRLRAAAGIVAALGLSALSGEAYADSAPNPPPIASAAPQPAASGAADGHVSKWVVDDKDPVSSIPTEQMRSRDPLEFGYWLQDCITKGLQASKSGDHEASIRYFTALAKAVPNRPVSFKKLCDEYELLNDRENAIAACGSVLRLEGVDVSDYIRYLKLIITKRGTLSDREVTSMGAVVQHLREEPAGKGVADEWECEVGIRTQSVAQLEECTAALGAKAPDAPDTLFYQWTLAMQKDQPAEAERILGRARATAMPPDTIEHLENRTKAAVARHRRNVGLGILASLLALVAAAALFVLLRRREPDPSAPPAGQPAPSGS